MNQYIPSPTQWVADQVELYEKSGGEDGTTLRGLPVIVVNNIGRKTGAIRKTPLMKVADGDSYVLVASIGGAPKNPLWYYNLLESPEVEIRDETKIYSMIAREIKDPKELQRLWTLAVKAYPLYQDYQSKTDRVIPIFLASKKIGKGF